MTDKTSVKRYQTFEDFYPYYLAEHSNIINRRLHFVGTSFALFLIFIALITFQVKIFLISILSGYGFAWFGHFFFEKNKICMSLFIILIVLSTFSFIQKPATFQYPAFSLRGDFKMWKQILTGELKF